MRGEFGDKREARRRDLAKRRIGLRVFRPVLISFVRFAHGFSRFEGPRVARANQ